MKLAKLKRLCKKATPGPWSKSGYNEDTVYYTLRGEEYELAKVYTDENDQDFIAAARTMLPKLIHAWETLFAKIEHGDAEHRRWLKEALDEHLKTTLEAE